MGNVYTPTYIRISKYIFEHVYPRRTHMSHPCSSCPIVILSGVVCTNRYLYNRACVMIHMGVVQPDPCWRHVLVVRNHLHSVDYYLEGHHTSTTANTYHSTCTWWSHQLRLCLRLISDRALCYDMRRGANFQGRCLSVRQISHHHHHHRRLLSIAILAQPHGEVHSSHVQRW